VKSNSFHLLSFIVISSHSRNTPFLLTLPVRSLIWALCIVHHHTFIVTHSVFLNLCAQTLAYTGECNHVNFLYSYVIHAWYTAGLIIVDRTLLTKTDRSLWKVFSFTEMWTSVCVCVCVDVCSCKVVPIILSRCWPSACLLSWGQHLHFAFFFYFFLLLNPLLCYLSSSSSASHSSLLFFHVFHQLQRHLYVLNLLYI